MRGDRSVASPQQGTAGCRAFGSLSPMPTVARLSVTPVKSTALNHPESIELGPSGAAGVRDFFFVNPWGKRFSGAAKAPNLLLRAAYDSTGDCLSFTFPDGRVLSGPAAGDCEALVVDFYSRDVAAHLVGGPWAQELSAFQGRAVRLARVDQPGAGTDEQPVTLVSLASVAELARRGDRESLEAARFRMTLELDGCTPHEEDSWNGRTIRIGGAELDVGESVPRCVVTTLNPDTGRQDFPTLAVIARYRELGPEGGIPFGMYAGVRRPGTICVGDPVELLPV